MAHHSDVSKALVKAITGVLFAGGNPNPDVITNSAVIVGGAPVPMRVYRGWPLANRLDTELAAGATNVTVYTIPNSGKNQTRQRAKRVVSTAPITVNATVSDGAVTFAGTGTAGQVAGVIAGNVAYAMRLTDGVTSAEIATHFGSLITNSVVSGSLLTPPISPILTANVVSDTTMALEVRRQSQSFQIVTWAPTPQARDAVSKAVSQAMAVMPCVQLPYGTCTERPIYDYAAEPQIDERDNIFRGDEVYNIQYATHLITVVPAVLSVGINTNAGQFGTFGPSGPLSFTW